MDKQHRGRVGPSTIDPAIAVRGHISRVPSGVCAAVCVAGVLVRSRGYPARVRHPRSLRGLHWVLAATIALVGTVAFTAPTVVGASPAACPVSLQALIDAAPAGGTLVVPPCTYREDVTVDKPLDIDGSGSTIDGRDHGGAVVRDTWMTIAASDVTVRGFTMAYADNQPQTGALNVEAGVTRVTITGCDLGFAAGADVSIGVANDSTISGCAIHDAGQLGVHLGGDGVNGHGNVVRDNRIYHNNTAGYDPDWEAGGLKATQQTGLVVADNDVYDNAGPGLWCDIYCRDATFSGNTVDGNSRAGIQFEVSTGAVISDNTIWNNGWADTAWCWSAGILLSSSGGATVTGNVLAWNASGISIISQDRTDWSHSATDDSVSGNVVAGTAGRWLECWAQDWVGELFLPVSANGGHDDRFWSVAPDKGGLFQWDGESPTLAAFAATRGGVGATYLSDGQMASLLTAAGVPTAPSGADVAPPLPDVIAQRVVDHPIEVAALAAAALVPLAAAIVVIIMRSRRRRRRRSAGPQSGRMARHSNRGPCQPRWVLPGR